MVPVLGIGAGIAIAGGLGVLSSGIKSLFGSSQYRKGKREMAALERPEYVIPPEVAENMTAAELRAMEGLPPEQKQAYVENIQRATGDAMASLQDRNLGVAGASGIFQQQSDAYRNLLGMDVAARQQGQQNLAGARLTMASFKDREQDINKFQPYMQDYMAAQSMMGAGMQNIGSGLQDITQLSGIGAMAYGGGQGQTA
tara:strand:+ start:38 stop:634 length:597 start_codon:yes stop_codon:yes gene_type:complete